MQLVQRKLDFDFSSLEIDPYWNEGDEKELRMHKIHAYPAKFPAFLTTKAISYATEMGRKPTKIADVFCGCGTVALEAKRLGIDFWGCDLNPVATLIARAKSKNYKLRTFRKYKEDIITSFIANQNIELCKIKQNDRVKYWFKDRAGRIILDH